MIYNETEGRRRKREEEERRKKKKEGKEERKKRNKEINLFLLIFILFRQSFVNYIL